LAARLEGLLEVHCWAELSAAGKVPAKEQPSALEQGLSVAESMPPDPGTDTIAGPMTLAWMDDSITIFNFTGPLWRSC